MMRIVLDHIHFPVKARADQLVELDPTLDPEIVYTTILNAVESGSVALSDLPNLTLRPKPEEPEQ